MGVLPIPHFLLLAEAGEIIDIYGSRQPEGYQLFTGGDSRLIFHYIHPLKICYQCTGNHIQEPHLRLWKDLLSL